MFISHVSSRYDGPVWMLCKFHDTMNPTYQQGIVHDGGGAIMIWRAFSSHRLCPLVILNQSLRGHYYAHMLDTIYSTLWNLLIQMTMEFFRMMKVHRLDDTIHDWFEKHSG